MLRVRASISRPTYGWGDVDHTSIGSVQELVHAVNPDHPDEVIIDFPEQDGWRGLTSEMEVVVDESEGETLKKNLKLYLANFQKQQQRPPRAQKMGYL